MLVFGEFFSSSIRAYSTFIVRVRVCACVCVCVYMYVCVCVCVYEYMYKYAYVYTLWRLAACGRCICVFM